LTRRKLVDEMMQEPMQNQQNQPQQVQVDPRRAFFKLQQRHAEEVTRMIGDLAAKDAYIDQQAEEIQALRQQIDQLNGQLAGVQDQLTAHQNQPQNQHQNQPTNGDGPIPPEEAVLVPTMTVGPPNPDAPPT
jgi:polyhydroxyalkanoate synthesis regulator phasin